MMGHERKAARLTMDAMLAAMCAVLGYLALDMWSIKITFESLPVLLGALLLGPVDGMLIGGVGALIYQLLRYGVTATTLLWIMPYVVCGLMVGAVSRWGGFSLSRRQVAALVAAAELAVTLLNTGVIYIDSRLYGWYYPTLIMGMLGVRLAVCVVKAAAFGVILPWLADAIRGAAFPVDTGRKP